MASAAAPSSALTPARSSSAPQAVAALPGVLLPSVLAACAACSAVGDAVVRTGPGCVKSRVNSVLLRTLMSLCTEKEALSLLAAPCSSSQVRHATESDEGRCGAAAQAPKTKGCYASDA